jgi:hypothetical protein
MCVGYDFPGGVVETAAFHSTWSLLDSDVIVFEPPQDIYSSDKHQGKYRLGESESFRFKETCQHWRGEMAECLAAGKTVIVFLAPYEDFFIDSGDRSYSGTGRNEKVTVHIASYDNYKCLPLALTNVAPRSGKAIKPAPDTGPLREYWRKYGGTMTYNLYFDTPSVNPLLLTKTGQKTVAGIHRTAGGGCMVLVPPVAWDLDSFVTVDDDGDDVWTEEATEFGHSLLQVLLGIDSAVRGENAESPPPDWALGDEYSLARERELRAEISELGGQMEILREQSIAKREEARKAARLRGLLFATGTELEVAVILALRAVGFAADNFDDGASEFDIVFESPEGRFLGEAEGKDNKAVNVDKLRQLEMNTQEDFQRDEVSEYATGVLFGNAYRLTDPKERVGEFFSEKCMKGAARSGTVLVRTPDLFAPARYMVEN